MGFEPTRECYPPTRFPGVHLRPLGHLSRGVNFFLRRILTLRFTILKNYSFVIGTWNLSRKFCWRVSLNEIFTKEKAEFHDLKICIKMEEMPYKLRRIKSCHIVTSRKCITKRVYQL